MQPTVLVYSSHNRSNDIHNDWIVQRALNGNKQILFLPMSEGEFRGDEYSRQVYSWGNFAWFFNFYRKYDLNAFPFYWNKNLSREDVDLLMDYLSKSEVVILGGGNPSTGLMRYKILGDWFYNDSDTFCRIIHERQNQGLLTVGFSAGVDQLCQIMSSSIDEPIPDRDGFGLCRNIIATSHFEHGKESTLHLAAEMYGHCLVFGLPNDSGLAINQYVLHSGKICQIIRFIIDNTWTIPTDQWHIKTRMGMKIVHIYPDGRHWAFNGGDIMVRIQSMDNTLSESFIVLPGNRILDYWTQEMTGYQSIEEILDHH